MKKLMKSIGLSATALCAAIMLFSSTAQAETTQCTPITSIPASIITQGIYCLTGNLSGNLASGTAIRIFANNVTIDFNGYKLGNLAAGTGTNARGIYAEQRKNITIRNGTIRGFLTGIFLHDSYPYSISSGHLIEDIRLDGNTQVGMSIAGSGNIMRNNQVVNTGGSTVFSGAAGIAVYGQGARVLNNDIIDLAGGTGNILPVRVEWADGTVVQGNRISNTTGSGISYGFYIAGSLDVMVSDNRMSGVPDWGVLYKTDSSGVYMNNTVSESTTPFSGGSPGGTSNHSN